jgi:hypothetical protein
MATTNGSHGQGSALRLADPLQHLQKVKPCRTPARAALRHQPRLSHAPDHAPLRQQLQRLGGLEGDLALLPIGWGDERKGPMLEGWQHHDGFTVAELLQVRGMRSVGARTGMLTGPLLAFDFDGATSLELGLDPTAVGSWQVHRTTDPDRLKVLFRPTLEQLTELPSGAEFHGKTITAPKTATHKGEALEVFFDGGRQVIVLGQHPSSGGLYFWPDGMGPEAWAPPPADWWAHALEIASQHQQRRGSGSKPSANRHGTKRLNPCPVCGRHNGPGGSALWCEQTERGLILCMPGSTFSAEGRHGPVTIGQVVDGWALVKRTPIGAGDVLTFKAHQPREVSHG